ncbi:MAG TPA: hypothetical protein VF950_26310 [Planctomycetota bacterium]
MLLDVTLALVLAQGVAGREPMDILGSFASDLRKAMRPNVDRVALQKAAQQQFDKELDRAAIKSPKLVWEYFNEYLTRLYEAERSFNSKDFKTEREMWVAACRNTLLKAAALARVPDEAPTTVELFNACVDATARVRSRITGESVDDLLISGYESVNHIFRGQLRRCRASKGDPKAAHTAQLTMIELRFGKSNDLPDRMLRDISKACLDKDVTARR